MKIVYSYDWHAAKEFITEGLAREEKEVKKLQMIKKEYRKSQVQARSRREAGTRGMGGRTLSRVCWSVH